MLVSAKRIKKVFGSSCLSFNREKKESLKIPIAKATKLLSLHLKIKKKIFTAESPTLKKKKIFFLTNRSRGIPIISN